MHHETHDQSQQEYGCISKDSMVIPPFLTSPCGPATLGAVPSTVRDSPQTTAGSELCRPNLLAALTLAPLLLYHPNLSSQALLYANVLLDSLCK